jgi:hypothetical protein
MAWPVSFDVAGWHGIRRPFREVDSSLLSVRRGVEASLMSTIDVRQDGAGAPPVILAPRDPRYLTLDLWRGLACLMIVVLHATHNANEAIGTAGPLGKAVLAILSRLGIGVPIFFVISGYCIAATSDSTRRKPRAPARFF